MVGCRAMWSLKILGSNPDWSNNFCHFQQYFVCDYDSNVDCKSSETFYNLNDNFGQEQPQQQSQRVARQRPYVRVVENFDVDADADVAADAVDEASVVENRNDARDAANFIDVVEKVDDPVDVDVDADAGVDATTLESRNDESFDNTDVDE